MKLHIFIMHVETQVTQPFGKRGMKEVFSVLSVKVWLSYTLYTQITGLFT